MYTSAKLFEITGDRVITPVTDPEFYYTLQVGVLLTLKEDGSLTEMQYRHAEETLKEQKREIYRTRTGGSAF